MQPRQPIPVFYLPDEVELSAEAPRTLLDVSLAAGLPHTHACGGNARCSTCRVMVLEGQENLGPRNEPEARLCERYGFDPQIRLACQATVAGPGAIRLRRLVLDDEDQEIVAHQAQTAAGLPVRSAAGEELAVAILFADIRDFTPFAEALPPYDVIHALNRFLRAAGREIAAEGGVIHSYMGDGIMALFGADRAPHAPLRAVRAGLGLLRAVDERVRPYMCGAYGRDFDIGVGVHYGEAVVGPVGGGPGGGAITAIGDAVNFASRIEGANKAAGTRLLISEETYHVVSDHVRTGRTTRVPIKGKNGKYLLYEVTGLQGNGPEPR